MRRLFPGQLPSVIYVLSLIPTEKDRIRLFGLETGVCGFASWHCSVTKRFCSVTKWHCSITKRFCSVTKRHCSVTKRFCSITKWLCSITKRLCSLTKRFCSLTKRLCSITKRLCSPPTIVSKPKTAIGPFPACSQPQIISSQ